MSVAQPPFLLQDPAGAILTDLRADTPGISPYRKFQVYNNQTTDALGVITQVAETGFSKTDQSQLGNRSIFSAAYTHSVRGAETSYLATGPISTTVQLSAELSLTILDGLLQISKDTFVWAASDTLSTLTKQTAQIYYLRYSPPTYPFTTRLTLKNIGANTFTSISLTPPSTDQLSTDGVTYANPGVAVNVGTLAAGASVTFWLKSTSILNLIAAQVQVVLSASPTVIQTYVPVQAAGGRAYCLVNDVRQYLKTIDVDVVSDDDEIMDLIILESKEIDRSTRRRFDVATVTELYDGSGQQKLVLDNYPIIAIQEVKIINADNQVITDIKGTDSNFANELIIDYVNGFITLPSLGIPQLAIPVGAWYPVLTTPYPPPARGVPADYVGHFGAGISNVRITYVYGFQQPPEPIRHACEKLVTIELLRKKGSSDSQGLSSEAIAGVTMQYSARGATGGAGPFGHMIAELALDVKDIMTQYRKRSWKTI